MHHGIKTEISCHCHLFLDQVKKADVTTKEVKQQILDLRGKLKLLEFTASMTLQHMQVPPTFDYIYTYDRILDNY